MAERLTYIKDNIVNTGGFTTGAIMNVGAPAPGTDWLFAEGFTKRGEMPLASAMGRTAALSADSNPFISQGFLVYPKYPYCMLASMREASPLEDEKDAIRVNQKALFHQFPPLYFLVKI